MGSYNATIGKIEISVNGATPVTKTQTGTFAPGNYDLLIGEGINSNRYFNGVIDDENICFMKGTCRRSSLFLVPVIK